MVYNGLMEETNKRRLTAASSNALAVSLGFGFVLLALASSDPQSVLAVHLVVKTYVGLVYFGMLLLAFLLFTDGVIAYTLQPIALLLMAILGLGTLSLLWTVNTGYTLTMLMIWYGGLMLAFLSFQIVKISDIRKTLVLVFLSCLLVSLIGIAQYLFEFKLIAQHAIPASTFANKNMATQYVVLSWLLGPYLFLTTGSRRAQFYYALATALCLGYVFYAQAQAGWVAILVQVIAFAVYFLVKFFRRQSIPSGGEVGWIPVMTGILLFGLLVNVDRNGYAPVWKTLGSDIQVIYREASVTEQEKHTGNIWSGSFIQGRPDTGWNYLSSIGYAGIGSLVSFTPDFVQRWSERLFYRYDIHRLVFSTGVDTNVKSGETERVKQGYVSFSGDLNPDTYIRYVIWNATYSMILSHPLLGVGLGGFEQIYQQYAFGTHINVERAHNDYLQTVAELGIGAALIIVLVLVILLRQGIQFLFQSPAESDLLAYLLLVQLAGVSINAIFSFPLQLSATILIVSLYLGFYLRLLAERRGATRAVQLTGKPKLAVLSFAGLGLVAVVFINQNWMNKLDQFGKRLQRPEVTELLDLNTLVEHPVFRRIVRRLSQQFQDSSPKHAEWMARSFLEVDATDVVVNNTLALSLLNQKKLEEVPGIIKRVRQYEPRGYYRSYDNELTYYTYTNDRDKIRKTLARLEREPYDWLVAHPLTLNVMAVAASKSGDSNRSLKYLKENIRVYPYHESSLSNIVRLYVQRGDLKNARLYLNRLKRLSNAKYRALLPLLDQLPETKSGA